MIRLQITNLDVLYGVRQVVHDVNLQLTEGQIGCLLGPSGCGKTTVLRAIAGFVEPARGEIRIRDKLVRGPHESVAPERRDIGMVFQDFALFPHLSSEDNIGFGLRSWSRAARSQRIGELLSFVEMETHRHAYPHQLSGGEQQRIALARAMAPRPSLILLDEPFSSMDVELRAKLARDVRRILNDQGVTALMVTHDQHEAFAMADNIAILNTGRIQQVDTPYNLYHHPANRFVADFIGEGVFLSGRVNTDQRIETALGLLPGIPPEGFARGDEMDILVRPDDVVWDDASRQRATVTDRDFRGSAYLYTLNTMDGVKLLSLMPSHQHFNIGADVGISFDLQHVTVYRRK